MFSNSTHLNIPIYNLKGITLQIRDIFIDLNEH